MRKKLRHLGLKLPLLPTTSVGSLPKPGELAEARERFIAGELTAEDLRPLEEKATREWIEVQEKIGLDVKNTSRPFEKPSSFCPNADTPSE